MTSQEPASRGLLRRLLGDMGYYIPAQLVSSALNLAAVAVFTRKLDQTQYGTFTLIVAGATTIQQFGFAWLQQSALRYWRGGEDASAEDREAFLTNLLGLFGLASILSAFIWPLATPLLFPGIPWSVAALGLPMLLAQSAQLMILARTRALRELRPYFWYSILPPLMNLGLGVLLIEIFGLRSTALVLSLTAASLAIVLVELARRHGAYVPTTLRLTRKGTLELVNYGLPLMAGAVGAVIVDTSDRFLIARFFGLEQAGLYSVGYGLAFRIDVLTTFIATAAFPLLIQDYEGDRKDSVGGELSKLISAFTAFFAPACAGLALVAAPVVAILVGPKFHEASAFIVPLMPAVFFSATTRYFSKAFGLARNLRPQVIITAVCAVLNLGLNLLLMPRFGPIVAAWTTSLGFFVMSGSMYVWSRRLLPYTIDWPNAVRVTAATAIMCAVVYYATRPIEQPLLAIGARSALGIVTYALAAFILGETNVRALLRRLGRRRAR